MCHGSIVVLVAVSYYLIKKLNINLKCLKRPHNLFEWRLLLLHLKAYEMFIKGKNYFHPTSPLFVQFLITHFSENVRNKTASAHKLPHSRI